ncbi:orotate phosphoribosyltransferase [Rickettsiales bacterium]|nr:orotate phosphoribosyltransferase [Rickettsiales bacterium]
MFNSISDKAAEILIDIGSVNFSPDKPFKLTSGKFSPVYCDCRRIISFPVERKKLIKFAITKIKERGFFEEITNIAGGETAGIPFSSLIASELNLPMTYIRKQKKEFGKKEQIEGIMKKSDNVILVEDLLTDGGSKLDFINAVENKGAEIRAIFVIFNYGIFKNYFSYNRKMIDLIYLTRWENILKVAKIKKKISEKDIEKIWFFLKTLGVKN